MAPANSKRSVDPHALSVRGDTLGLSPGSERGSGIDPDSPWLALAKRTYDEEVVPASATPVCNAPDLTLSAPAPAATIRTPRIA
jgi:hypothetical protein